ncbi:hypothetical protein [Kocuria rhizophila]
MQRIAASGGAEVWVRAASGVIPLYLHPKGDLLGSPAQLLVLLNGAVDLSVSGGRPVFQRSTWAEDFPVHVVNVCDPGTVGPNALPLAWGQVDTGNWIVPDVLHALRVMSESLGVQGPEGRTYFGSSAGGFLATQMAVHDIGARAVVNNAQVDWTRWMAPAVKLATQRLFGGMYPKTIRTKLATRANFLDAIVERGHPQNLEYWVNIESRHDRTVDLPQIRDFIRRHPELSKNFLIRVYTDAIAGHNPLDRKTTVRLLNGSLAAQHCEEESMDHTLRFDEPHRSESLAVLDGIVPQASP